MTHWWDKMEYVALWKSVWSSGDVRTSVWWCKGCLVGYVVMWRDVVEYVVIWLCLSGLYGCLMEYVVVWLKWLPSFISFHYLFTLTILEKIWSL